MERFAIEEYVRWSDVDFAGIIRYDAYLRLFELAETELFRHIGLPFSKVYDLLDIWMPRVQMHCDFHNPAKLDDLLRVSVHIAELRRSSICLKFEVDREGLEMADGHFYIVTVDRTEFRPIAVPEDLKRRLKPYTVALYQ